MHFYFIFPRFKLLSGAERLVLRLGTQLAVMEHCVTVLCHQMHSSCRPLVAQSSGLDIIETGRTLDRLSNRYLNAPFDYFSSVSLLHHITDPDGVCVFFGPSLPALVWLRYLSRHKNRCLYFCYEPPRFIYRDRAEILRKTGWASLFLRPGFVLYSVLDRAFVKVPERVLTQGSFGRSEIEKVYGRAATIIPHGSDFGYSDRPPRESFTVLTVNYLHPRKRIDLFVRTVRRLLDMGLAVRGVVAGDGPERRALEELTLTLGLTGFIRFTGFVGDALLPALYFEADAYLHTAKLESFGLSVLDALASGLPVVSVNEGGPTEMIVDRSIGYLAPALPDDLAERLLILAGDPSLRSTMGRAASAAVRERYTWKAGAEALVESVTSLRV